MLYKNDEMDEVIKRIKDKVLKKDIDLGNTVGENDIIKFEQGCKIKLPQGYRRFLMEVGNGGIMIDGFRLKKLNEIEIKDISKPFLLEEPWLWEEDERGYGDESLMEEINTKVYSGNIELIDIGCAQTYNLIISGTCAGEVWFFTGVGVCNCCERRDFLSWYEYWLDGGKDYFKDYKYDA